MLCVVVDVFVVEVVVYGCCVVVFDVDLVLEVNVVVFVVVCGEVFGWFVCVVFVSVSVGVDDVYMVDGVLFVVVFVCNVIVLFVLVCVFVDVMFDVVCEYEVLCVCVIYVLD